MTNGEKYKTAAERSDGFIEYCNEYDKRGCRGCKLKDVCDNPTVVSAFYWLDLEAKTEDSLPCPFCGEQTAIVSGPNGYAIICDCGFRSKMIVSRDECICEYNRVARAAAKEKDANDANA